MPVIWWKMKINKTIRGLKSFKRGNELFVKKMRDFILILEGESRFILPTNFSTHFSPLKSIGKVESIELDAKFGVQEVLEKREQKVPPGDLDLRGFGDRN